MEINRKLYFRQNVSISIDGRQLIIFPHPFSTAGKVYIIEEIFAEKERERERERERQR